MRLIEDFRHMKPIVLKYIKDKGIDKVSEYAAMTGTSLIAIWTFIKEDMPEYRQKAENKIESLKKFYRYVEEE